MNGTVNIVYLKKSKILDIVLFEKNFSKYSLLKNIVYNIPRFYNINNICEEYNRKKSTNNNVYKSHLLYRCINLKCEDELMECF